MTTLAPRRSLGLLQVLRVAAVQTVLTVGVVWLAAWTFSPAARR
jgi:hypothetical protein